MIYAISYFVLLSFSYWKCISYCRASAGGHKSVNWRWYLLMTLSLCTFVSTWYYIGRFLVADYQQAGRDISSYFDQSDLFDGAYRIVSDSGPNWWWTKRHLITAVSWTMLIWMEALEGSIWFILLGFFGAVGGSFPLWIIYYLNKRQLKSRETYRNEATNYNANNNNNNNNNNLGSLTYCLGLAIATLVSIVITPKTLSDPSLFSLNLKMLHVHLILQFLAPAVNPNKTSAFWLILSVGCALAMFLGNQDHAAFDLYSLLSVWSDVSNPCQTSINIDAVSTIGSILVLIMGGEQSFMVGCIFSLFTLFAWPVAFPSYLAYKYYYMNSKWSQNFKQ